MRFPTHFPSDFRTHDRCILYLFEERFSGTVCPKCKRKDALHKHPTKDCFTCNCGSFQVYPKTGTLFERSHLPLHKWFLALFLLCESDGSLSAKELERKLDVPYPTAWKLKTVLMQLLPKKNPNFARCLKRSIHGRS